MKKNAFLIAPSGVCDPILLKEARESLLKLGFIPKNRKDILTKYKYYAGDYKRRSKELMEAYLDQDSQIIFSILGGAGSVQLIESLNYEIIKNSNKILIGSSDITILLNAIYQKTNARCIHGQNLNKNFKKFDKKTISSLMDAINKKNYRVRFKEKDILYSGKIIGKIVGGNLNLLERSLGTKFEINTENKILFLEDVRIKEGYILDMLWQLKLSGKFEKVKGIILGNFKDCGKDVEFYLREFFKEFQIPIILNQPIGHDQPNIAIPLGEKCYIDTEKLEWGIIFD